MMDPENYFFGLFRPLFRKDASFNHDPKFGDGLLYRIDWKLPEAGRPNKRSRPIEIVITPEVVEDHHDAPRHDDREAMERRMVSWLEGQLSRFDPSHNYRPEQVVPAVRWTISPEIAGL